MTDAKIHQLGRHDQTMFNTVLYLDRVIPVWTMAESESEARCRALQQVVKDWSVLPEYREHTPSQAETREAVEFLAGVRGICDYVHSVVFQKTIDKLNDYAGLTDELSTDQSPGCCNNNDGRMAEMP